MKEYGKKLGGHEIHKSRWINSSGLPTETRIDTTRSSSGNYIKYHIPKHIIMHPLPRMLPRSIWNAWEHSSAIRAVWQQSSVVFLLRNDVNGKPTYVDAGTNGKTAGRLKHESEFPKHETRAFTTTSLQWQDHMIP